MGIVASGKMLAPGSKESGRYYRTLHPNDVIWFGCDGPTEPALRPGDMVEVMNDAIGILANRVVAEKA